LEVFFDVGITDIGGKADIIVLRIDLDLITILAVDKGGIGKKPAAKHMIPPGRTGGITIIDAERISHSYPHELSGGQRQRVVIAQAIACGPSLIVADEPTASLDPTTQQEILQLFRSLQQKLSLAMILITHNPALLAGLADRILVLYAGRVAEVGPAAQVLASPQHPYTAALLRCLPSHFAEGQSARKTKLRVIPGDPPDLSLHSPGCQFEPRCTERMEVCKGHEPSATALSTIHDVSCFKFAG